MDDCASEGVDDRGPWKSRACRKMYVQTVEFKRKAYSGMHDFAKL